MTYKADNLSYNKHCFFANLGGVSADIYKSLNVNVFSQDNPQNISQNLEIIAQHFGLGKDNIAISHQGFSNIVNYVDRAGLYALRGDGMVTDKQGIILGISTADCAPVLFQDEQNHIIGAAHAGWRSALGGVIENTVSLMIEKGAYLENIKAAVGPCLQKTNFEAGSDMLEEFISKDKSYAKYFTPHNDRYLFDFEQFVYDKISSCGVDRITLSHIDTYADENYFSFRRNTHLKLIKQPKDFPTELSAIVL